MVIEHTPHGTLTKACVEACEREDIDLKTLKLTPICDFGRILMRRRAYKNLIMSGIKSTHRAYYQGGKNYIFVEIRIE
jgi:hypothetical protein